MGARVVLAALHGTTPRRRGRTGAGGAGGLDGAASLR